MVHDAVQCKRFVIKSWLPRKINVYTRKHMCYMLINFGQTEEKPSKHWKILHTKLFAPHYQLGSFNEINEELFGVSWFVENMYGR